MSTNLPSIPSSEDNTFDNLLVEYFQKNLTYLEIKEFLYKRHGIDKSLSIIKRHLKRFNLIQRPLLSKRDGIVDIQNAVREELNGSGANIGYRRVWTALKRKGFIVRREDVIASQHLY